jgi:hypothetical protein
MTNRTRAAAGSAIVLAAAALAAAAILPRGGSFVLAQEKKADNGKADGNKAEK